MDAGRPVLDRSGLEEGSGEARAGAASCCGIGFSIFGSCFADAGVEEEPASEVVAP